MLDLVDEPSSWIPTPRSLTPTDNVLATVNIWKSDAIKFAELPISAEWWRNIILVERSVPLTPAEQSLYTRIANEKSAILGAKNVYRIIIDESSVPLTGATVDDRIRTIERMRHVTKQALANFGFVLVVNPTQQFALSLRDSDSRIKLVAVVTDDLHYGGNHQTLSYANSIITAHHDVDEILMKTGRRFKTANSAEGIYRAIEAEITDLYPKEFNVLLPAYNCWERLPEFDTVDTSITDVVLWLNCGSSETPTVKTTFAEFATDLASVTARIALSEEYFNRYRNLAANLETVNGRSWFIRTVFADGARVKVLYE
ncbi:hypothetical protein [Rhizobium sp. UGM030330-04]|uniref:hypothetical protein n=1 Tax=Rhizobium sp. UGM030330-04 TaxID=1378077 RepID=UPI000D89859E|nr:hypothetical protein [Rhizobium sp. UGM030330-04]PYG54366.1 hypothetical protein N434_04627 [Rhizobium sp. UGM030330-04]